MHDLFPEYSFQLSFFIGRNLKYLIMGRFSSFKLKVKPPVAAHRKYNPCNPNNKAEATVRQNAMDRRNMQLEASVQWCIVELLLSCC